MVGVPQCSIELGAAALHNALWQKVLRQFLLSRSTFCATCSCYPLDLPITATSHAVRAGAMQMHPNGDATPVPRSNRGNDVEVQAPEGEWFEDLVHRHVGFCSWNNTATNAVVCWLADMGSLLCLSIWFCHAKDINTPGGQASWDMTQHVGFVLCRAEDFFVTGPEYLVGTALRPVAALFQGAAKPVGSAFHEAARPVGAALIGTANSLSAAVSRG